ncbi:MAG TPA: ABC transporter permease, partial [Prolixibacteraceae bacterium]|nr:ABC transporter permease [Prolixibacteraceae bacterium]
MNITNWKISIRNILKHKSLSLINILGLAFGLAASLLIMMHVTYEYSYDRNWDRSDDIFRISYDRYQNGDLSFRSAKSLRGMATVLREKVPEVIGGAELLKDVVTVYNEHNQIQDIQMFVADSAFFTVFNLDFIRQKDDNPLTGLYSAILSESAALSLFGTTDAVGKWFKVCQGWRFCVSGVYKNLPSNTHIPFDMVLTWKTYMHYFQNWDNDTGTEIIRNPTAHINKKPVTSWNWGNFGVYTYLLIRPGSDPKQVESKIEKIAADYTRSITKNDGKAEFHLQPITEIHLDSHLENEIVANGDRNSVLALVFISLVILCIAWINFINLTLIRAVEHAKSTGLRKIAGATKKQLVGQFMAEALVTNLISIVIALALVFLLKGWFASVSGMDVVPAIGWRYLVALATLIFTGILVSGLYPALYLSSFKPVDLFKGIKASGTNRMDLRKSLVVAQFAASIFLIAGVLTVFKQISYMKSIDLGVNIDRTIVTYSPPTMIGNPQRMSKIETYKSTIRETSGVESITTSSAIPGKEILWKRQDIRKTDDLPNTVKSYAYTYIDYDFVKTFNLEILAGRNFTEAENENNKNLIVNEMAIRQLGFTNPEAAVNSYVLVGTVQYQIIGVLKDFHQESLRKEIKPVVFFFGYQWMYDIGYYSIKVNTADLKQTIGRIENSWNNTYPEDHFKYFFLDDKFNAQYKSDQAFGRVFTLFTFLAIFIASIGLFGLAVYSANQRTKEIGIRKVNGARDWEI